MSSTIFLKELGKKTMSRTNKTLVNQPAFHLSLIFFLGFFHIGLLSWGFSSPLVLLFVPLIYLTCKANENLNTTKNIFKHSLPFFALSLIDISCHTSGLFESAGFVKTYTIFSLLFTLIVSVFYLILIILLNRSNRISKSDKKSILYNKLIGQLCLYSCFMMCMGVVKLIISLTGETDFSILIKILWITFFISIRLLIALTWYRAEIQSADPQLENERVVYDEKLNQNKVQLLQYLEQSEIFLDPDLTLPALAEKTGMSEREFSKLLNQYMGHSFYHLIAKYRIAHAIKLIEEETNIYTIDSMAGHCGFNSKTSFNRYFKEFTGSNPSEYRAKLVNK
jgi:AraC-like DNA-binding protein